MLVASALFACAGGLVSACVSTPSIAPTAAPSGDYRLDPQHASLVWRIGHANGLSRYTARFDRFDAALVFDPTAPEAARLEVVIEAASVNTGLPAFDEKLAAADDVFDADTHPQIRFVSTKIEPTGPATGRVSGNLTLRGQTAPVTLEVTYNGGVFDPLRGADAIGFSATGAFDRTVFGADAWTSFGVGREVEVQIEAEFLRR
jgi:polyisoprenoid-binding protein YceI